MKEYNDKFKLDYGLYGVPEHTRESLERYLFEGIEPGGFLYSVLTNDLYGACTRCDHVNKEYLVEIVRWVFHEAPRGSWGHQACMVDWIKDRNQCRTKYVAEWERQEMWRVLNEQ